MKSAHPAPGRPGLKSHWVTSRKNCVGTARGRESHVWFTTHRGILGEIYYPRVDLAAVKDMGMIVTDGEAFFSEEKTATHSHATWLKEGVPGFALKNVCVEGRYEVHKEIITDPDRHVVLQRTKFKALKGKTDAYHLYALMTPHLGNQGAGNNGRVEEYKGIPMLMAEREGIAVALACSAPWLHRSAGYVGISDGWQDLHAHKRMTWNYDSADDGTVALTGEIDLSAGDEFVLAMGFGATVFEAAHRARASLEQGYDKCWERYERQWSEWQNTLRTVKAGKAKEDRIFRVSTAVLATHESKDFPGGTIASLSFPWGEAYGDKDQGGYHLVWPRDAYESAGALLAADAKDEVMRALSFFRTTQEADGHWSQNMWLDGTGFWTGIQLDEVAAPILLLDLAHRHRRVNKAEMNEFWPMVRQAVAYIVRKGPSSPQDRWEEDAGLTAYTLGALIAALLVAADLAEQNKEEGLGAYLRDTADSWNRSIERWTYVEKTALAKRVGVDGYYVRIAPKERLSGHTPLTEEPIEIANRSGQTHFSAAEIVSVDALALVRFGLRAADDPRILNTVRVIDSVLKVETPHGPCWHRYNHDGYGEKEDGSPFNKTGIGRVWPLLTGERAHYELAAGNKKEAQRLLATMESLADETGLISEQVWDSKPIPEKDLYPGRPSGSARPLVWAHAEYVKLLRSLADEAVFDTPPQTMARYLGGSKPHKNRSIWRFDARIQALPRGDSLRIETMAAARIHWTSDGWETSHDTTTKDSAIGICFADLDTEALGADTRVIFTFFWTDANRWEEKNFEMAVGSPVP
jgi:glucoamylase